MEMELKNRAKVLPREITQLAAFCKQLHCVDPNCTGPSATNGGFAAYPSAIAYSFKCRHLICSACRDRHYDDPIKAVVECGRCRSHTHHDHIVQMQRVDEIKEIIVDLSQRGFPCSQCTEGGSAGRDEAATSSTSSSGGCCSCLSRPNAVSPATVIRVAPKEEPPLPPKTHYFHREAMMCCRRCSNLHACTPEDTYAQRLNNLVLVCRYCARDGRHTHRGYEMESVVELIHKKKMRDGNLDVPASTTLACKNRAQWHLSMCSAATLMKIEELKKKIKLEEPSEDE